MFDCRLISLVPIAALAVFAEVMPFTASAGNSVTLAWNASDSGTLAGYRLYSGIASQTYADMVDIGNATTATVSNLLSGTTYYFAVTAYDIAGLESAFSSEISYTAPTDPAGPADLGLSLTEAGEARLTCSAPSGYAYDVLASPDLLIWTTIGSAVTDATGVFQFTDSTAPAQNARYYRLRQTLP